MKDLKLDGIKLVPSAGGWIWQWSDGRKYYSSCDELSLGLAIEQFRSFIELDRVGR